MKSKATLKTIEKLMKKSKLNMKRAKARADQAMFFHHQSRYQALAG